jgi:hypothetical protein
MMRHMTILAAAFAIVGFAGAAPAEAAGCLKGAAVGGVAGHMAGKHGVLGAGAGCVVGRHEANKSARQKASQTNSTQNGQPAPGAPSQP